MLATGTVLAVLIAVVWTASWWWSAAFYCLNRFGIHCYRGVINFSFGAYGGGTEWHLYYDWNSPYRPIWWPRLRSTFLIIPLWLPWIVIVSATFYVWFRFKPTGIGFCKCGYDLTGNVSGVCPECGTATADLIE